MKPCRTTNDTVESQDKGEWKEHILPPQFHLHTVQKHAKLNNILCTDTNIWGKTIKKRKGSKNRLFRIVVTSEWRGGELDWGGNTPATGSSVVVHGNSYVLIFIPNTYFIKILSELLNINQNKSYPEDCQTFQLRHIRKVSQLSREFGSHRQVPPAHQTAAQREGLLCPCSTASAQSCASTCSHLPTPECPSALGVPSKPPQHIHCGAAHTLISCIRLCASSSKPEVGLRSETSPSLIHPPVSGHCFPECCNILQKVQCFYKVTLLRNHVYAGKDDVKPLSPRLVFKMIQITLK